MQQDNLIYIDEKRRGISHFSALESPQGKVSSAHSDAVRRGVNSTDWNVSTDSFPKYHIAKIDR